MVRRRRVICRRAPPPRLCSVTSRINISNSIMFVTARFIENSTSHKCSRSAEFIPVYSTPSTGSIHPGRPGVTLGTRPALPANRQNIKKRFVLTPRIINVIY